MGEKLLVEPRHLAQHLIDLFFADDQRRISLRLTDAAPDLEKGLLSSTSPLGEAVQGVEEGDEIELTRKTGDVGKL